MAKRTTMNISLPPKLRTWVERQVEAGGFGTSSEFIRHILRDALSRQQAAQEDLEQKLLDGLNNGPATPMTKKDWADIRRSIVQRHSQRTRRRKAG